MYVDIHESRRYIARLNVRHGTTVRGRSLRTDCGNLAILYQQKRIIKHRVGCDYTAMQTEIAGHIAEYRGRGIHPPIGNTKSGIVPAQSREQFQPRIEGSNLFGRGSSDVKGGLAAMIHTAAARDEGFLKAVV